MLWFSFHYISTLLVLLLIINLKCDLHNKGILYRIIISVLSLSAKKQWGTVGFDKYWSRHLPWLAVHDQKNIIFKLKVH